MPNFNKGDYLKEAIQSVVNQSYIYWNLYIIDDYSNDLSKKILKEFEKNKKIKIIYLKKNRGPSYCRNLGIFLSKSPFISFLDSDDYWPKNKLSSQLSFMIKKDVSFTYTDYISFYKENKKKFLKSTNIKDEFNFKTFVRNSSINTSTMILKKEIIKNIKFKNIRKHEDYVFKCEILRKNKNLFAKKFKNSYAFYRILKNSRSRNKLKSVYYMWLYNRKFNKY